MARRMRPSVRLTCLGTKACSQIRSTLQPPSRRHFVTRRSRDLLRRNFAFQNPAFVRGLLPCLGQPCQKHPSTKTASFRRGNTKSGRPVNREPRRHPVIPCLWKISIRRSSVPLFPELRTQDITADLFDLEKTSAIPLWHNAAGQKRPGGGLVPA
jgi:hypothetical protein